MKKSRCLRRPVGTHRSLPLTSLPLTGTNRPKRRARSDVGVGLKCSHIFLLEHTFVEHLFECYQICHAMSRTFVRHTLEQVFELA